MITPQKNLNPPPDWISEKQSGVVLNLWIQPGAKRSEIIGPHGTPPRLKVKIKAPPVDGAANEEVLQFFATLLILPAKNLKLVRGQTSRQKDLLIVGSDIADILKVIEGKIT